MSKKKRRERMDIVKLSRNDCVKIFEFARRKNGDIEIDKLYQKMADYYPDDSLNISGSRQAVWDTTLDKYISDLKRVASYNKGEHLKK